MLERTVCGKKRKIDVFDTYSQEKANAQCCNDYDGQPVASQSLHKCIYAIDVRYM